MVGFADISSLFVFKNKTKQKIKTTRRIFHGCIHLGWWSYSTHQLWGILYLTTFITYSKLIIIFHVGRRNYLHGILGISNIWKGHTEFQVELFVCFYKNCFIKGGHKWKQKQIKILLCNIQLNLDICSRNSEQMTMYLYLFHALWKATYKGKIYK